MQWPSNIDLSVLKLYYYFYLELAIGEWSVNICNYPLPYLFPPPPPIKFALISGTHILTLKKPEIRQKLEDSHTCTQSPPQR